MKTREMFVVAVILAVVAWLSACGSGGPGPEAAPLVVRTVSGSAVPGSTAPHSGGVTPSAGTTTSASSTSSTPSTPSKVTAVPTPKTTSKPGATPTAAAAGYRVMKFVNNTSQTVWPAAQASAKNPLAVTGWVLPPGGTVSFQIPDHYNGRIWGRTGCAFDASGHGRCVTGDCDGKFQCGYSGSVAPETLAEFDLSAWGGMDFYDVNMDGFNLPMYINHTGGKTADKISPTGCIAAGCTKNLLDTCPTILQVKSGGVVVGCVNPCQVLHTDPYCCKGAWSGRANCKPTTWPIDYAAIFKKAEPFAYSYAYDDSATYTCSGACDYRITFGVSP